MGAAPPHAGRQAADQVRDQTPTLQVFDGYNNSEATVVVGPTSVIVKTTSTLDPGFQDVGFVVDKNPFVPADRYDGPRTLIFEKDYPGIVAQFKKGHEVRFALRFWPTWPATGTHEAVYSLIGFTKAYEENQKCKPD